MERTQIITPKGVAVYPRLGKADTKFVAEGEFSIKVRLDRNDAKVAEFIEKIEAGIPEAVVWARGPLEEKVAKAKTPADKGKAKKALDSLSAADSPVKAVLDEDGNETNMVEVRFKAKAQFTGKDGEIVKVKSIPVRDAKKNAIDATKVLIGGGSEVKVAALMYPYYNAKDNVAGVTFRLQAVQVLKLVRGGGGGDFGFGEEEGDEIEADDTPSTEASEASGNDDF